MVGSPRILVRHDSRNGHSKRYILLSWSLLYTALTRYEVIGTLHAWIANHQLKEYSQSQVGWIFSTFPFFLYFAGAQIGPLFDVYGALPIVIPGSIGLVASVFFLSVSKGRVVLLP